MAIDEDAINDALNTPTYQLGYDEEEPDEPELPDEEEGNEDPDEPVEVEDEPEDPVDALLGKQKKPENRVQRLANERREAEERATAAERRAEAAEARAREQESALAERQRLARQQELDEMDPTERRLLLAENEARQARFEAADGRDAQQFSAIVSQNPHLKGLAADVEKELKEARSKGLAPTREAVAKYLLGERAFKKLQEAPALKKAGKARVDQARGRPVGAGSDAVKSKVSDKGDTPEARERRLTGVRL